MIRLLAFALLFTIPLGWAQTGNYPNRAVKFVVPFPAGGPVDSTARTVGQKMTQLMHQPVILDLRSADGENDGLMSATNSFRNRQFPLVILVNGQTRGAAAMLATDLRAAGDGILVGSADFSGATKPDIAVTVSVADENNFLANPFFIPVTPKNVSPASTNEFEEFVDHTSEDDLVRQRVKDGDEDSSATPRVAPSAPVVRDPALARALDLFKAMAALHPARG